MNIKKILLFITTILSVIVFKIFNNLLLGIVLIIGEYFYIYKLYNHDRRKMILCFLFSLIFSSTQVVGYNCYLNDTAALNKIMTYISILILAPTIFIVTWKLYNIVKKEDINSNKFYEFLFEKKYSLLVLMLLMILSYLPILIAFYPGNFSYDAGTQLRMLKFNLVTKYHPVIHTFFLYVTIFTGNKLFSSYNIGLSIHSISQIIIMTLIFSYTLIYLNKKKFPKKYNLIFLLLYMFLPTHSVLAITTTKDIIFSGLFNLVLIKTIELSTDTEIFLNNKKNIVVFIIICFLLLSFRNNMFYAFLLFIPFVLVVLKKYYKKLIIVFSSIIFIFESYNLFLSNVLKIEDGPRIEMFSFVVQQFGRVYNKEKLTKEERKSIESLYKNNALEKYNSHISDPIKSEFNTEELLNNKSKYLKLYFNLLKKYPNTFIDSIVNNVYSFFYLNDKLPDKNAKTYIEINCLDTNNNTFSRSDNCSNKSNLYKNYYKLVRDAKYQNNIILNVIMNMSFYVLIFIFVIVFTLYKKNYKLFLPLLLLLLYLCTDILAPVAILRYVYPFFTAFPIIIYMFYESLDKKVESESRRKL